MQNDVQREKGEKVMRKWKGYAILTMAVLMAIFTAYGCTCNGDDCKKRSVAVAATPADITAPYVTLTQPTAGQNGVRIDTVYVTAAFSEPMAAATIQLAGTFTVKLGLGPNLCSGVVYAGLVATCTLPASTLLPGQLYTAMITNVATDVAGNHLVVPAVPPPGVANSWTFTTETTPASNHPYITFEAPYATETVSLATTSVKATFSEMMIDTFTTLTFTVKLGGAGANLCSVVAYAGLVATCTLPAGALLPGQSYTAQIASTVTDLDHLALIANVAMPNPWTFTTGSTSGAPYVTSTTPADRQIGVNINTVVVSATFSEAMNPGTITTGTFTLNQGSTVIDCVSVAVVGLVATCTPNSKLKPGLVYTAEITSAQDNADGTALVVPAVPPPGVPNPWTFWTGNSPLLQPGHLGTAANFAILAFTKIDNTPFSPITGDVGLSPGTGAAIAVSCPEVTPPWKVFDVDGTFADVTCLTTSVAVLNQARDDLWNPITGAYVYYRDLTLPAFIPADVDQGGLTLAPGIYKASTTLKITGKDLTLDAQGDQDAVWIFQVGSSLTTVGGAPFPSPIGGNVILANGAQAKNVFWVVAVTATIGDYTRFPGTIMASTGSITLNTGAQVTGRLLAGAAVTLTGANTVTLP
jgi:hypothetical protein